MGGALIIVAIASGTLLWGDLTSKYLWVALLTTVLFGAIGWVDDYRKVLRKTRADCLHAGSTSGSQWSAWRQSAIYLLHRLKSPS